MKKRVENLLSVKSIVTIFATLVFCYLAIRCIISSDQFMSVFTMIIGFYFGTQHEKKNKEGTKNDG